MGMMTTIIGGTGCSLATLALTGIHPSGLATAAMHFAIGGEAIDAVISTTQAEHLTQQEKVSCISQLIFLVLATESLAYPLISFTPSLGTRALVVLPVSLLSLSLVHLSSITLPLRYLLGTGGRGAFYAGLVLVTAAVAKLLP